MLQLLQLAFAAAETINCKGGRCDGNVKTVKVGRRLMDKGKRKFWFHAVLGEKQTLLNMYSQQHLLTSGWALHCDNLVQTRSSGYGSSTQSCSNSWPLPPSPIYPAVSTNRPTYIPPPSVIPPPYYIHPFLFNSHLSHPPFFPPYRNLMRS